MALDNEILGKGVYTPREAARLIGTNAQDVLRWTRGSGPNEPLWHAHYNFLDEDVTEISFLDLIEVRVVAAMRREGISLQSIRFAINYAKNELGLDRPLASSSFQTDGTEILMDAIENDGEYVSLSKKRPGQKVFRQIVSQSLKDLEYEGSHAARWRPRPEVVLDPARLFGEPILNESSISTGVLREELKVYGNAKYLSNIYEIPLKQVQAGISFEDSLDVTNGKGSS